MSAEEAAGGDELGVGRTAGVDEGERAARAALARVAEPGDPRLGAALAGAGAGELLAAIRADGCALPGATAMRIRLAGVDGSAELARGAAVGARFICPGEPEFPTQLEDLGTAAPFGLWLLGEASLRHALLRSVAMVGSRAATAYGLHVAAEMAAGVAEKGWTVVSGCAFGIDAAAHRGALAVDGTTIGVLAGGVDVPYPMAHAAMIERIVAGGVLVSESAPGAAPARRRFLTRNRLIAAMTRGTVVVEAALRSGAATTARWADDLGRTLMAVPGPVTSAVSLGSNELLRARNAVPVTRPAEIIEALGRMGDDLAPALAGPARARDALPERLVEVIEAMPSRGVTPSDAIGRECGLVGVAVAAALGELAARGLVERVDGGWRLTKEARAR